MTLGLLDANYPDISPHDHRHNANSPNSSTRNQHVHLRVPVRPLDRDTSRRAHRIRQLHCDVLIDLEQVREFFQGEVFSELLREDTLPDSGSNGQTNCASDVTEHS